MKKHEKVRKKGKKWVMMRTIANDFVVIANDLDEAGDAMGLEDALLELLLLVLEEESEEAHDGHAAARVAVGEKAEQRVDILGILMAMISKRQRH